jgi:ABC-type sugar transport system permease subunit
MFWRPPLKSTDWFGYLLVAPALLVLLGVIGFPLVQAAWMSMHQIVLTRPDQGRPFVGFQNYLEVISAPYFVPDLINTAVWVGVNLGGQMLLGLAIAVLLNQAFWGRGLARGILLIPWILPSVVSLLTWRWMYDAQFGVINSLLVQWGFIERAVAWLGNTETALGAVIVESIWKGTPFVFVMLLAALQAVPRELYDSSRVDGANMWQSFRHITLPMIQPTLVIAATLTTIYTFNNFNAIWLLTEGGPLRSSETLNILVYKQAFQAFDLGQATATGMMTFAILLVFVALLGRSYVRSQIDL